MQMPQMPDPFGGINNFIAGLKEYFSNPMGYMAKKGLQIPEQYANNPDGAIQYLMDEGKITQAQYNWAKKVSGVVQKTPVIRNTFMGPK